MDGKANPYGRLMALMGRAGRVAAETGSTFLIGEMQTGAQIKVGDLILAREDYVMLTHEIEVNGKVMKIPYKKQQSASGITIPPLKKGDKVLCCQISDEEFVVFGKVE